MVVTVINFPNGVYILIYIAMRLQNTVEWSTLLRPAHWLVNQRIIVAWAGRRKWFARDSNCRLNKRASLCCAWRMRHRSTLSRKGDQREERDRNRGVMNFGAPSLGSLAEQQGRSSCSSTIDIVPPPPESRRASDPARATPARFTKRARFFAVRIWMLDLSMGIPELHHFLWSSLIFEVPLPPAYC